MKKHREIICDICGRTVAWKSTMLYHTDEPYITFRRDEPVTYVNYEENTTKSIRHMCQCCFDGFTNALSAPKEKCKTQ